MFKELEKRLQVAQDTYTHACEGLDAQLHAIVSRDPAQLSAAQALQAQFAIAPAKHPLAAAEHAAEADSLTPAPTRTRRRATGKKR